LHHFKVSDKISFLNQSGEGEIVEIIDSKTVKIKTEEGFIIKYPVSEIVKKVDFVQHIKVKNPKAIAKIEAKGVKKIIIEKESEFDKNNISKKHIRKGDKSMEVDLHAEHLLPSLKGLSNGEILQYQLNYFHKKLDEAITQNYHYITFIHGIGEGVLKSEIRRILHQYPKLIVHDASYRKYGFGATEVEIL